MDSQIPDGLQVFESFILPAEHDRLAGSVSDIFAAARRRCANTQGEQAPIPQPSTVRSHAHNLPSEEYYVPLKLELEGESRVLSSAYFPKYGAGGHELVYFSRGTLQSLPLFAREFIGAMVPALSPLVSVEGKWRLTLNSYLPSENSAASLATRPGFPFHKDLPANGDVTLILTLLAKGDLELVPEMDPQMKPTLVQLRPGSLLVLSGEARWRWLHRIRPLATTAGRLSVVFGWKATSARRA